MNVRFTKYCSYEKLSYSKHEISTGSPKALCKIHDYEYNQTTSAASAATSTTTTTTTTTTTNNNNNNNNNNNGIVRKINFISK